MRPFLSKCTVFLLLFATFGSMSSLPPLPTTTSVTLTDIQSDVQDDYQIKVAFEGEEYLTGNPVQDVIIINGPFSSSLTVSALHKIIQDVDDDVCITVWSRPSPYSNWEYFGDGYASDGTNVTMSGTWVVHFDYDWDLFYNP